MAQLVVSDPGEVVLLRLMLSAALVTAEDFRIHLYRNDYTPNRDTALGDLTEADFDGSDPIDLLREEWGEPETVDGVARIVYGAEPVAWECTGGSQTVYGYYVTDSEDSVLLWSQRLGVPVAVSVGVTVSIQPVMRLRSQSQPPPP